MSRRVCILNNKGGVGKTLTAAALAEAAAKQGAWVLAVDMDPQANLTRRLQVNPTGTEQIGAPRSLTTALKDPVHGAGRDFLTKCRWPLDWAERINVLTADLDLEDRVLEAGMPGAVDRLATLLGDVDEAYGLTIIDCPPSIKGHLTQMAIAACTADNDTVLVPLTPDYDGIGGARRAVQYVRAVRGKLRVPKLDVSGLIVNSVRRTNLAETRMADLDLLLKDVPVVASLPLRAAIAEIQDAGEPLGGEPSLSGVMAEFDDLAKVLLNGGL